MDSKTRNNQKNNFLKLSLKKNRPKANQETKKANRSSDVIILDDSFDKLNLDVQKNVNSAPTICSPITIIDSCNNSYEPQEKPSNCGNTSINGSKEKSSPMKAKDTRPSFGGWSPAQHIIYAVPRNLPTPSTPKDVANESLEECSIKKIQQSQKKLLNDLYGEVWKSIPKLFKGAAQKHDNFDGVSKKLDFNDEDSDKENVKLHLEENKKLYLTGSDVKRKVKSDFNNTERKSKKKLYTEKIPNTPEPPKMKVKRNVNSTSKKLKGKSITELVEILNSRNEDTLTKVNNTGNPDMTYENDVKFVTEKVKNVAITPLRNDKLKRESFVGSLINNIPSWRCHVEALQYHDNFKALKEQLTRRLYAEFNKGVFDDALDADLPIIWDTKLRSTAGTTTNRLIKNSKGDQIRTSSIKLSTKVLDGPQRARDTLIHEMCHVATWLLDGELRAGHGPLWKKWATRALRVYPELGAISRCHNLEIHFKYVYICTKCGYSIKRHSKSIDIVKKCCGYCHGKFEIIVNKKRKDGVVVSTPARKGEVNDFAKYVKENYGALKNDTRTHAQVMKILGEQFSAKKNKADSD